MTKPVKSAIAAAQEKYGLDLEQNLAALAERALDEFDGNRTHAAASLGISVRTMRNWIKRFNLAGKYPVANRGLYRRIKS
jgi:hypothetical protein